MSRGAVRAAAEQQMLVIASEPEIPLFTGQSHRELEHFLADYNYACVTRPDWTDAVKSLRLWRAFAEAVQTELSCQGLNKESRPAEMIGALKKAYGDRRSVHQLIMSFQSLHQEGYENTEAFSQRLFKTFSTLKSAQERTGCGAVDQAQLMTKFIEGLRDPGLKMHLRQKKENTPDVTFSQLRDYAKTLVGDDSDTPKGADQQFVQTVNVNADLTERLVKMMERMEERIDKLEKEKAVQPPVAEPRTRQAHPSDRLRPGPWRCFDCDEEGHIARDCPYKRRNQGFSGNAKSQR